MATATPPNAPAPPEPTPAQNPTPAPLPTPAGVVFENVSWADYEAMLGIVGDRPIRVTYDRGRMEVRRPSFGHEADAYLLGRMVDVLTEELGIPVEAGGTTTHRRQDLDRGAEPDQCYWLGEKARRMLGKTRLDLGADPAPDLVVEVDVSHSSVERLPIFAAMGVPEVWRLAGGALRFLHLQADGSYPAPRGDRRLPRPVAGRRGRVPRPGRGGGQIRLGPFVPRLRPRPACPRRSGGRRARLTRAAPRFVRLRPYSFGRKRRARELSRFTATPGGAVPILMIGGAARRPVAP